MPDYVIPRSQKGLETTISISGAVVALLCVVVTICLAVLFHGRPRLLATSLIIIWVGMIALWIIGAAMAVKKWAKTAFVLTKDSLLIKRGQLFGTVQDLYRYESILSVTVNQSFFGERKGYGTVSVTIPKVQHPIHITYAVEPEKQAQAIKQAINRAQSNTQSLIN